VSCSSPIRATFGGVTLTTRSTRPSASLITNAVILWTTTYFGDAVHMRADSYPIADVRSVASNGSRPPSR